MRLDSVAVSLTNFVLKRIVPMHFQMISLTDDKQNCERSTKNEVFHEGFLQTPADLVIFTGKILDGKLHFLRSGDPNLSPLFNVDYKFGCSLRVSTA